MTSNEYSLVLSARLCRFKAIKRLSDFCSFYPSIYLYISKYYNKIEEISFDNILNSFVHDKKICT